MAGKSIADNLRRVEESIAEACTRAKRSSSDVRLIAVSKTKPIAMIEEAMRAGQKSFGENYVQEAVEKVSALPSADWHFIGSLQSNKVKQVVGRFALIQSVDRIKLVRELAKVATAAGVRQDILLQIHIGDEETKHGFGFDEAPSAISEIGELGSLRLRGLMSLPPLLDDEHASRANFARLREALEKWRSNLSSEKSRDFTELSIGTSSDYEWAIQEGATMVRVGTAIFGERA